MKLSKRLMALVQLLPSDAVIADIGTDHGYLPIYAVENGLAQRAIAADVNQGPLKSAEENIRKYGLEAQIEVRLGNGLQVLAPQEVNCITIAGMGGVLMREILERSPEVLDTVETLILEPNKDADLIRLWGMEHGRRIADEDLVYEDGHFYAIICLKKGQAQYTETQLLLGPKLMEKRHTVLEQYLQYEEKKDRYQVECLGKSKTAESAEKIRKIEKKWERIEEEYAWRN